MNTNFKLADNLTLLAVNNLPMPLGIRNFSVNNCVEFNILLSSGNSMFCEDISLIDVKSCRNVNIAPVLMDNNSYLLMYRTQISQNSTVFSMDVAVGNHLHNIKIMDGEKPKLTAVCNGYEYSMEIEKNSFRRAFNFCDMLLIELVGRFALLKFQDGYNEVYSSHCDNFYVNDNSIHCEVSTASIEGFINSVTIAVNDDGSTTITKNSTATMKDNYSLYTRDMAFFESIMYASDDYIIGKLSDNFTIQDVAEIKKFLGAFVEIIPSTAHTCLVYGDNVRYFSLEYNGNLVDNIIELYEN